MFFCLLNLKKAKIFALMKTCSSFSTLAPGCSLAGGIHPGVGRLICLHVCVWRQRGEETRLWCHSHRVPAFSPGVSPVATHRGTPFSVSHSLETVIIEIHICAPLSSSTFRNVASLVTRLSYCWLHTFKCMSQRYTRSTASHCLWECAKQAIRGPL